MRNWEWPRHSGICVSSHRYVLVRRVLGSALTWNCHNAILWPKKGNKHTHETNASLPRSFSESWISASGANSSVKTEPSHCSWYYSSKAVLMATFGKKYKIKSQKVWKKYFLRKGNVYPGLWELCIGMPNTSDYYQTSDHCGICSYLSYPLFFAKREISFRKVVFF